MNRDKFYEKLNEMLTTKRNDNSAFFTREKYDKLIADVKAAKVKCTKPNDYRRMKRFDILRVQGRDKLIAPLQPNQTNVRFYVTTEELFDILVETHTKLGHTGRDKMLKELQIKYKNITHETVLLFLSLCEKCQEKRGVKRKRTDAEMMELAASLEQYTRCQVDVIDLPSNFSNDNEFKFLLVYQDYLTKFVQLRPLKSKSIQEVADHVLNIFSIFGAPVIIQSNNGRDFSCRIVAFLREMWKDMKIVHGEIPQDETQSTVSSTSQDIQNMLTMWMSENGTDQWSHGVPFVQFSINTSHHPALPYTPYEAMFKALPKRGLGSYSVTQEQLENVQTEEQLEKIHIEQHGQHEASSEAQPGSSKLNWPEPLVNIQVG